MNIRQFGTYAVLATQDATDCADEICKCIQELIKGVNQDRLIKGTTQIIVKTTTQVDRMEDEGNEQEDRDENERPPEWVTVAIKYIEEVPENEQQQNEEQD